MSNFYDDVILQQAMQNFGAAKRKCNSEEMKLICQGLSDLAFALNEFQKRVHFIEEQVGVPPLRGLENLLVSQQ